MAWSQSRRAVSANREACNVFVAEIVVGFREQRQECGLATGARDVFAGSVTECILDVSGVQARVQEVADRSSDEPVGTLVCFLAQEQIEVVPAERLHVPRRVAPGPIEELIVVLVDRGAGVRLGIFRRRGVESRECVLTHVEAKPALQGNLWGGVEAREHVPKDVEVLLYVVSVIVSERERVAGVAESRGFSAGKIPGHVINRNDRLQQDILAEDAALSEVVVRRAAVMPLETERHVLTEVQLAPVECGVDANASALEVVVLRRATLMEIIEGDPICVLVAPSVYFQVVIPDGRRIESLSPPVGAGAAGHDQSARIGVPGQIDVDGTAKRVDSGARRVDVLRDRRIVGIPVDVGRDGQARVDVALSEDLGVV